MTKHESIIRRSIHAAFQKSLAGLEDRAWQRFPMICGIEYGLSGQHKKSIGGLAYIGRNPMDKHNVYIPLGDSGNAMTHGPIAGMVLADLMCGRANEWAGLYDPSRIALPAPQASNFPVTNTCLIRKQNQAANATSDYQLQNFLIYPSSHNQVQHVT